MNKCNNIENFIKNNDLNLLNKIYNCNCNKCNLNKKYNEFYEKKIKNIVLTNNYDNNINLIWNNTMKYIKEYIIIFENNINNYLYDK